MSSCNSGAVAMVQQGPWMANYIRNLAPDMSQVLVPFCLEPFLPRIVRPFNYEWAAAPFPAGCHGSRPGAGEPCSPQDASRFRSSRTEKGGFREPERSVLPST